jgi:hypothetical protein
LVTAGFAAHWGLVLPHVPVTLLASGVDPDPLNIHVLPKGRQLAPLTCTKPLLPMPMVTEVVLVASIPPGVGSAGSHGRLCEGGDSCGSLTVQALPEAFVQLCQSSFVTFAVAVVPPLVDTVASNSEPNVSAVVAHETVTVEPKNVPVSFESLLTPWKVLPTANALVVTWSYMVTVADAAATPANAAIPVAVSAATRGFKGCFK